MSCKSKQIIFLDCTLRDGGYYNKWNFSRSLVKEYFKAVEVAGVDIVELGFRSLNNSKFSGAFAYTTDDFIKSLNLSNRLTIGVMVNASELINAPSLKGALKMLFPLSADKSPVGLVRIACHVNEFEQALKACSWLKERGFLVGFNLMQIANCDKLNVKGLARLASQHQIDVLYFADSMGSMAPHDTVKIIKWIRSEWRGDIGIHTHDNLGLALSNTLCSLDEGATWVDSTVTGMGRGSGNARTEELAVEIAERRNQKVSYVLLMKLIKNHFKPMQALYGWGANFYYYLAGKYDIHPTYIQTMLSDSRYDEEDMLSVVQHLQKNNGSSFSRGVLDAAFNFYSGTPLGSWSPASKLNGRVVLLLGTGPGVARHSAALEQFIVSNKPIVIALNTQDAIKSQLIDMRIACHPIRLLADCDAHIQFPQPLIAPYSMLPNDIRLALSNKKVLDFGIDIKANTFSFNDVYCTIPTSLVVAYSLATITSGCAKKVLMAGFDGYKGDDPRNSETNKVFKQFQETNGSVEIECVTPTRYDIHSKSIYGVIG